MPAEAAGLAEDRGLVAQLNGARGRAPGPDRNLDHVAATAETVVARAQWITRRFSAEPRRVLFLGDHDLTSLAVARLWPAAQLAVVDVDERLLDFLGAELAEAGADFRIRHADLRRCLPTDLVGWADVFVTDPPYTPEGVALFCARGAQALAGLTQGRGLLAYGYGDGQPALGLAVQKAVLGLDCVIEELIPDFNHYHGAAAIGGASDWHVLRFAPSAQRKTERFLAKAPRAIYTHGHESVEAKVSQDAFDLRKSASAALFRALLWESAPSLELLVDNNHPDLRTAQAQAKLVSDVAGKWSLRFRKSTPDSASAVLEAVAQSDVSPPSGHSALRAPLLSADGLVESARGLVLRRPEGKLKNVLREARILAAGGRGAALTKNEARAWVGSALESTPALGRDLGECLVGDAPRSALRVLLDKLEEGFA